MKRLMHEGPARQNRTGDLSFVARGVRDSASDAPRNDYASEHSLGLFGGGQFDGRPPMIWIGHDRWMADISQQDG